MVMRELWGCCEGVADADDADDDADNLLTLNLLLTPQEVIHVALQGHGGQAAEGEQEEDGAHGAGGRGGGGGWGWRSGGDWLKEGLIYFRC